MKKTDPLPAESETKPQLAMANRLARFFRALTPYSQVEFGRLTGIHPSAIGHFEAGDDDPSSENLEAMARVTGMSVAEGIEVLRWCHSITQPRLRAGQGTDALLAEVGDEMRARIERDYQDLLRLPAAHEKQEAEAQIALLRLLDEGERSAIVKSSKDFQNPALADCAAKESAVLRDGPDSAAWARLAQEITQLAGIPARQGRRKPNGSPT